MCISVKKKQYAQNGSGKLQKKEFHLNSFKFLLFLIWKSMNREKGG